jgi:hypothetical protein
MEPTRYATAAAFRRALEDTLQDIAGKEIVDLQRLRRQVVFDRLLARLFWVVSRKSIEVLLSKIEKIGVDESGLGRMLGSGSVIVRGTGGTLETFSRIAEPNEFRGLVQQQVGALSSSR